MADTSLVSAVRLAYDEFDSLRVKVIYQKMILLYIKINEINDEYYCNT